MTPMPLLAATAVHKTYRLGKVYVPVLRGVDLNVERGEWVAILGASGSGKSTLLHLLGGLDRPDRVRRLRAEAKCRSCSYSLAGTTDDTASCPECGAPLDGPPQDGGRVTFQDQSLADMSDRELDRYRNTAVGFVFQFYHLLPELKVIENVLIGSMIRHGLRGTFSGQASESRDRARKLLESFGLGHRLDHRPSQLSGGERQRVAIARALINDPAVLLADEPTGNLDRKTGRAILDTLVEHRKQTGRTMVIVTHDLEVAERADRVVHLVDGLIVKNPAEEPQVPPTPPKEGILQPEASPSIGDG